MAAVLKEHLQQIGQPSMDLDGAKVVEQALLIGDCIGFQTLRHALSTMTAC